MDFNVSKREVMHVGKTNHKKPYYMSGKILKVVDQEKDFREYYQFRFKVITAMSVCL